MRARAVGSNMWRSYRILMIERLLNMKSYCVYWSRFHWLEDSNQLVWTFTKSGQFNFRSFYTYLSKKEPIESRFPYWQILKVNAPLGVAFFAWEASRECILTTDRLKRRGKILVNWCYLCKKAEETCNQLLLWCPVAHSLWHLAYGLLDINWVIASTVKDELWAWKGVINQEKVLSLILLAVF